MDDGHVEVGEELHASPVGSNVGVRQVVDQATVVDDVTGIQGPGALFQQGNASRCVAGKVQYGQYTPAQVDLVTVVERAVEGLWV